MRILLFGKGSIGSRHERLIKENFSHEIIHVPHKMYENGDFSSIPWSDADVAFICTPTDTHVPIALECARHNLHLFIEKPLSNSLEGVDELHDEVKDRGLTAYVAYPLRFHPDCIRFETYAKQYDAACIYCKTYAPAWPSSRTCDHTFLELSHELDYIIKALGIPQNVVIGHEEDVNNWTFWLGLLKWYDNTININVCVMLDMYDLSETQRGYELAKNDVIKIHQDITIDDSIYKSQLDYFFSNIDNPNIMNNLDEAVPIFKFIMELIDKCGR